MPAGGGDRRTLYVIGRDTLIYFPVAYLEKLHKVVFQHSSYTKELINLESFQLSVLLLPTPSLLSSFLFSSKKVVLSASQS